MIENQCTISEWAVETFGYMSRSRSVTRMIEEIIELNGASVEDDKESFDKVSDECADVYITLCQIASTFGFDLHACIDHKMQINRARKWNVMRDGTGYHVKEL